MSTLDYGARRSAAVPAAFTAAAAVGAGASVLGHARLGLVPLLSVCVWAVAQRFGKGLLTWKTQITALILVVMFIPIRRYTLPGALPFQLEPYRLLVALIAALWIASLLIDRRIRIRRTMLDGPLLASLLVLLCSIAPNTAMISQQGLGSYVVKTLTFSVSFVIVYYVITSVVRTWHEIDTALVMLVGCGTIVAAFALFEARTGINVFNHLSRVMPILHQHAGGYLVARGGRLRALASAQHPIALGAMLVLLLPYVTYLSTRGHRRLWLGCGGLLALGAISTVSRTAILMLVVEAIVFLRLRPAQTRRLWPLLLPLLIGVHLAVPGAVGALKSAFLPKGGIVAQQQSGANTRGSGRLADLSPSLAEASNGLDTRPGRRDAHRRGRPEAERGHPRRPVARPAARHRRLRRRRVLLADPSRAPDEPLRCARGSLAEGPAVDGVDRLRRGVRGRDADLRCVLVHPGHLRVLHPARPQLVRPARSPRLGSRSSRRRRRDRDVAHPSRVRRGRARELPGVRAVRAATRSRAPSRAGSRSSGATACSTRRSTSAAPAASRSVRTSGWVLGPGCTPSPRTATDDPVLVVGDGVCISGKLRALGGRVDPPRPRRPARPQRLHLRPLARVRGRHPARARSRVSSNVRPVTIGDGAWLGQGVVVCPGVNIGRGAVIGAGSVVRHDVPAYTVAVGAPARVVRDVRAARADLGARMSRASSAGARARLLLPAGRRSRRAAHDRVLPPPARARLRARGRDGARLERGAGRRGPVARGRDSTTASIA